MNLSSGSGGRRWLFGALYFTEGAPIGFLWWALPTFLREGGADVGGITALTAALALPWSLKFLGAPLVDLSGGRHRVWIVACQAAMALTLLPLALFEWAHGPAWLLPLLIVHACAAAMQDVSIDAYAVGLAPEAERGSLTAAMQTGMLAGRWLFGAGLLLAAAAVGARKAVWGMLAALGCVSLLVLLGASAAEAARERVDWAAYRERIGRAARRPETRLGLLLAAVGGAGYEAVGVLLGPLLVDRGYSSGAVGGFLSLSVVLMAAGAWLGGRLADRLGPATTTLGALVGCFLAVASSAGFAWMGGAGLLPALAMVYLALGAFTAASYALLMNLTDPKLGGLQFSLFMAGTNFCEAWAGFAGGRIAAAAGYPAAFLAAGAASLLAVPALIQLRRSGEPAPQ